MSRQADDVRIKYKDRVARLNPCHKEQALSFECMDKSFYNREKCFAEFENYRHCKAFWAFVYSQRKKKGVKPYLTPIVDREKVKEEYLPHFSF